MQQSVSCVHLTLDSCLPLILSTSVDLSFKGTEDLSHPDNGRQVGLGWLSDHPPQGCSCCVVGHGVACAGVHWFGQQLQLTSAVTTGKALQATQ